MLTKNTMIRRELQDGKRRDLYVIEGSDNLLVYEGFKYYIVSNNGKMLSLKYDMIEKFENGIAVFRRGSKKGVVNADGVEVLKQLYDRVALDGGVIRIGKGDKWGLADRSGKIICSPKYEFIEKFVDGYARIKSVDGFWGIIKADGKLATKVKYYFLSSLAKNEVIAKNYKGYGVIDLHDNVVVPFGYKYIRCAGKRRIIYNSEKEQYIV